MDAWHLAVARLTLPQLAEPGEELGFATSNGPQRDTARTIGIVTVPNDR